MYYLGLCVLQDFQIVVLDDEHAIMTFNQSL